MTITLDPRAIENGVTDAERLTMATRAGAADKQLADGWVECASALLELTQRHPELGTQFPPPPGTFRLHAAIDKYVGNLRSVGKAPEATVIAVKRLVHEAAAHTHIDLAMVMQAAVAWTIDAYYAV